VELFFCLIWDSGGKSSWSFDEKDISKTSIEYRRKTVQTYDETKRWEYFIFGLEVMYLGGPSCPPL
jgi:hypothetical protein